MALVVARLNEENQKREDFIQKQNHAKQALESIYEGAKELDILEVTNYKNYLGKIVVYIKNQEVIIAQINKMLRIKQAEVTEALKQVKILEKLKETQERKFYQHYEYMQAKEIDDIASTRYKVAV